MDIKTPEINKWMFVKKIDEALTSCTGLCTKMPV
jgi:hypothetical protein